MQLLAVCDTVGGLHQCTLLIEKRSPMVEFRRCHSILLTEKRSPMVEFRRSPFQPTKNYFGVIVPSF
ncbi:hypothetical protein H6G80_34385 [Nostoc sp. FACHB-87]|uniref:hypothetical protein n=1 Tax=Nostocaceae TaxID=1162 RepID=UPI001683C865|nr:MULTISPECIES: hypothetical protein [Nostocaceae]MBD2459125.1 hypothetical protein [Nostoc sp. FACHB-87]MBD2479719.1 hypothetical protein [Anabaena sp. FACHB-83]